jgi:PLAC8 family
MKLSWIGSPVEKTSTAVTSGQTSAYKILFVLAVVKLVVDNILGELSISKKQADEAAAAAAAAASGEDYGTSTSGGYSYGTSTTTVSVSFVPQNIYDMVDTILSLIIFLYVFIVVMRLRAYVRHKYRIRGTGCEDCCCGAPCVICHTARHTADYKKYSADLCSETGLAAGVPEVV